MLLVLISELSGEILRSDNARKMGRMQRKPHTEEESQQWRARRRANAAGLSLGV
jgi:hypothetical protein